MSENSESDLLNYLRGALVLLMRSIQLYHQGEKAFYRVAALQLRILLCDTTRRHGRIVDISLLPRVLPNLQFFSLDSNGLVDPNTSLLPLVQWLDQTLNMGTGEFLSIRTLIRRVCDQDGGAHVDSKIQSGLNSFTDYAYWVIRVGTYVSAVISQSIDQAS